MQINRGLFCVRKLPGSFRIRALMIVLVSLPKLRDIAFSYFQSSASLVPSLMKMPTLPDLVGPLPIALMLQPLPPTWLV